MASTERLSIDSGIALPIRASAPAPNSRASLPRLGLGVYRNTDPKPAVLAALKHGYKHIDTARMYGNEQAVGEAVRESGVPRGELFITSKVAHNEHGSDVTPQAIEESVKRLGLGYIDLMLIHDPLAGKQSRLEAWKAFVAARDKGLVHNIGVSNYNIKHLEEIQEAGLETPAVNQLEIHPLCQQKDIVEYCRKHDIVVEAYTPLIRGGWNDTIVDIGTKYNKDAPQVLVRWSLQRGFVPLPKTAKPERVVSNAQVYDFELSAQDMQTLDSLDRGKEGAVTWNPIDAE